MSIEDTPFTILDLLDLDLQGHNSLNLRCLCGRRGLSRTIEEPDVNRPGLTLSGFYDSFAHRRVQVFGHGEVAYLNKLIAEKQLDSVHKLFSYNPPCSVFTHDLPPPPEVAEIADGANCPVLQTDLPTTEFTGRLIRVFSNIFAPVKTMHGVHMEIFGVGILILGESGIGKSEIALELIERGHRLVADDIVELRCPNGNTVIGQGASKLVSHHMELRGLGVINIMQMYGVGSIRDQKEVQIVAKLEEWDSEKIYDRVGDKPQTMDLLGVNVPFILIPVKPGRNVPIIIEAVAKNERLKSRGYFSALEFNRNVLKWIETKSAKTTFYSGDDSY
jgi:HPr kinase/phosphorylase